MDVEQIIKTQLNRRRIAFEYEEMDYHEYLAVYKFVEDLLDELGVLGDE